MRTALAQVAVFSPVDKLFDYLIPEPLLSRAQIGVRVLVPFGKGKSRRVGVIVHLTHESDVKKLKPLEACLDEQPLFSHAMLQLSQQASRYYHVAQGEVLAQMLPSPLKQGRMAKIKQAEYLALTPKGQNPDNWNPRAKQQQHGLQLLQQHPEGLPSQALKEHGIRRAVIVRLLKDGYIQTIPAPISHKPKQPALQPNPHQRQAITELRQKMHRFSVTLLQGVTGSGKTEVYLQIIAQLMDAGMQALVLVPEIGLTPQTYQRFEDRLGHGVVLLHSDLSDSTRTSTWLQCQQPEVRVVIGTRSALFAPLPKLGLIIVDEEHDTSFKQQEGLRYHARDMAILHAKNLNIPVLLGSATPSLESWYNASVQRYDKITLPQRAGSAELPTFITLDIRGQHLQAGLAKPLLDAMKRHLQAGKQVMLFINRRGYSPILLCHECAWQATCQRCDAKLTLHRVSNQLLCHYCGSKRPIPKQCQDCQSPSLHALGTGTQQLEQFLCEHFCSHTTIRIDRDQPYRNQELAEVLRDIARKRYDIVVGTQMLAKGHHFPDVSMVGILDVDGGFLSSDFRGAERAAQLILQVAGRAGREGQQGEVFIQTHLPEHRFLASLQRHDYDDFARLALQERQPYQLPPFGKLAVIRAQAKQPQWPLQFLGSLQTLNVAASKHGPIPASLSKKGGDHRYLLVLAHPDWRVLSLAIAQSRQILQRHKLQHRVRWTIDVDPLEF